MSGSGQLELGRFYSFDWLDAHEDRRFVHCIADETLHLPDDALPGAGCGHLDSIRDEGDVGFRGALNDCVEELAMVVCDSDDRRKVANHIGNSSRV